MRLCSQLTIAVVEKAGYGWSETTHVSRDINTIYHGEDFHMLWTTI